jgi:hypothetical protein
MAAAAPEPADFVFTGTVERLGAATMPEVDDAPNVATVHVDALVRAPDAFAWLAGTSVTVLLAEPGSPAEGEQALFLAAGWLYGAGVALRELEHHPPGSEPAGLAPPPDPVAAHVADADVVISGRVTAVRPSQHTALAALEPEPAGPVSEHDPQWWEAVVDVDQVVKGDAEAQPTVVLFPGSMDVVWHRAPKFHVGQQGVWMLHADQVPAAALAHFPQVYTVLHPEDFVEGPAAADEVRKLL